MPTSDDASSSALRPRVAVVVVHGVADQKPGDTMQSVVDLLVSESPNGARYEVTGADEFTLHVDPLSPDAYAEQAIATRPGPSAPPDGTLGEPTRHRAFTKSVVQSLQSDFHRVDGVETPDWKWAAGRLRKRLFSLVAPRPLGKRQATDDGENGSDRGLELTRYLLGKAIRYDAPKEDYSSRRVTMTRTASPAQAVDVYEMYWADLSRLASALPRIVTELLTMIFRLSRLGRDTVDEAAFRARTSSGPQATRRWVWLSTLQSMLDWAFVHVLAQLYGQLLLVGAFLLAMGAIAAAVVLPDSASVVSLPIVGLVVAAIAVACLFYFSIGKAHRPGIVASLAVAAIGGGMFFRPDLAPFGVALIVFVVLSSLGWLALRTADEPFPFVRFSGAICWIAVLATALVSSGSIVSAADPWSSVISIALRGVEWTLAWIKWWWIVVGPLAVLWVLATTLIACRAAFDERASAATGRLGLLLSLATFVALSMALWATLQSPLQLAVEPFRYLPDGATDYVAASDFLGERFEASTAAFAAIASILIGVLVFLAATILPSVLAELRWTVSLQESEARRLGRWLTLMYRGLDSVILGVVVVGAVFACLASVYYAVDHERVRAFFAMTSAAHPFGQLVGGATGTTLDLIFENLPGYSRPLLHWLVLPAASLFAALTAFGGILSKVLPGLRGPLDVALDVDNYLREFPRARIPRARIFARYAALLDHVAARGYDRIVIVAHSQGTVISAEFLRFLSSRSTAMHADDRRSRVRAVLGSDVRLLTLGCPLRQLYAARFPSFYRWIIDAAGKPIGPRAREIGAELWVNAFASGDYVGRWLWSAPARQPRFLHPMIDRMAPATLGRHLAYDRFDPMPPDAAALGALSEYETCIGFGAHTHYFDPGQQLVASMVDRLVAR